MKFFVFFAVLGFQRPKKYGRLHSARRLACCCTITMDGSLKISKALQNLIISAKGLFSISLTYIN